MIKETKILIVDDEEDIVEFLKYNLDKEGYKVKTAYNGEEAIAIAHSFHPHLIILDIMMPKLDGLEVCKILRSDNKFPDTIIAFLTARSESFTEITALEKGGDDFIHKPIKPSVFKARVKALLRRHPSLSTHSKNILVMGDLIIDFEQFSVSVKGKRVVLAKKEFEILSLLTSRPGKVYKRSEILSQVWGREVIVGDRTIDVHIRKLREKLGIHYIYTIKGVGYKIEV